MNQIRAYTQSPKCGLLLKAAIFIYIYCFISVYACAVDWPKLRPGKEYRTVSTDQLEIIVQRNGELDIRSVLGPTLINNATPLVEFAGEKKIRKLRVDPRFESRIEVNDRLGKGQGLSFSRKNFDWYVRSYPAKPFITVQLTYINHTRKPVRVAKLIPWSVGETNRGSVYVGAGAAQTQILENGRLFSTFNDYAEVVRGKSLSQWNLMAYNAASGQMAVAGFLTNRRAYTQIRMERTEKASDSEFNFLRAECVYDPPVTVNPGETLESELFYLALAEDDPFFAMNRFGKAMAVVNGIRDERPFVPSGWDSWSTGYHTDISEAALMKELDIVDKNLKRYGWTHFAIDAGWEKGLGEWEPNLEKFPHGMKWIADEIHARGMTAGIWIDPFTVMKDSPLAKEHPDWFVEPNALGSMVVGSKKLILDITALGARDYIRKLGKKIGQEWGFDALMEADFVYYILLADRFKDSSATKIDAMHLAMKTLREGFGEDKFIMTMTPQPVNALHAQGIRIGRDCQPIWRCENIQQPWGAVETLTSAIRRYYMTPHLYIPDADCAFFGHPSSYKRWNVKDKPPLAWDQSVAWLTGQALLGGTVKIGEPFSELNDDELNVLKKLMPSPQRPATPVDLFRDDSPRIWYLPFDTPAGEWHIVGVFNWDENAVRTVSVAFTSLGLKEDAFYTVYDFWKGQYYGTAKGLLTVQPPQGGVCLLGLRPYEDHPMLIASNRHYTQGAMDHSKLEWNPATMQLRGTFDAVADTQYTLSILVPAPFDFKNAAISSCPVIPARQGNVLTLSFQTKASGPMEWVTQF